MTGAAADADLEGAPASDAAAGFRSPLPRPYHRSDDSRPPQHPAPRRPPEPTRGRVLIEVAQWLFTPASLDARRLGYLSAAISLQARAARCRRAWAPHEAHCHAIVERAVDTLERRRTVLVLGSGLMRDVPLGLLAARFARVVLVDVIHLWPIRLRALVARNVELISLDLTGTTDLLLKRAPGISDPFLRLADIPDLDLVISANCLSQLSIGPADIVETRKPPYAARFPDLERRIVAAHLAGLRRFPARICLLTDTTSLTVDGGGAVVDRHDLLHGIDLPEPDDRWTWTLAPPRETRTGETILHEARGYVDFGRAGSAKPSPGAPTARTS